MTNHLPMNTTHEYTDDQIQTAIDRACVAVPACRISLANWTKDWREEKAQRLSIAKAFLLAISEPTQEEKWRAEFEKCFPDFDLTKQQDGGYLHAHAATAWRAFLAAKKGGAK